MQTFRFPRSAVAALLCCAAMSSSSFAQVVINEISSVQSDRLLQRPASAPPRLGNLPAWHESDFTVPAYWQSGPGPHGFGYTQATNVGGAMINKTPALYLRRAFSATAAQATSAAQVELAIDYDDGFVAYLNGVEVARRNTGAVGSYAWHHQEAFNSKPAGTAETIVLGPASTLLRNGPNILAIQVHNSDIGNGRLFCSATLRIAGAPPQNLVVPGDSWNWFAGTYAPSGGLYDATDFAAALPLGPDWTQPAYADSGWTPAAGALGFDTAKEYTAQLGTNLLQMRNTAVSVYMRREFSITQAQLDALTSTNLTVDWDDGYVLYLNGYELSRAGVSGAPGSFVPYNATAPNHGGQFESGGNNPAAVVSIPVPRHLLRLGRNVISAQLHNTDAGSTDLLLDIRFSGVSGGTTLPFVALGSQWRYKLGTAEVGTPAPPSSAQITPAFLDWLELKNTTASAVNLGGWTLTDDAGIPAKWTFPSGTTIPANGYLVVACSGRDVTAPVSGGMLHTNFSLSSSGEYLILRDAGNAIQSVVNSYPEQDAFHTWGRDESSGEYRYLDRGTPGAANVPGTASNIASEVEFDKPTGFHAAPLAISLSTLTPGAQIRYTLDGSEPTATSTLYTGPFDPTARPVLGPGTGTILREFFQWNGTFVAPPNFPANATPTSTQLISQLETGSNIGDYYTQRVRGFIHPPQTGTYEFYIATDDDGELWLGTSDNPSSKRRIAYIASNWAGPRDWTRHATQKSIPISLVAGQRYYIEVLQSEGGGGDNMAVGWSGPGLPTGINVVEGRYLSPPATLPPGTSTPPGSGVVRARAFAPGLLPSEVRTRNYVTGLDPRLTTVPAIFLSGPAEQTFYAPDGIFAQVGGNWNSGSWAVNNPLMDYNFAMVSGDAFERPAALEIVNPGNKIVERTTVGARFAGSPWSRPQYRLQGIANTTWNNGEHSKPQLNLFFRSDFGISKLNKSGFIPTSTVREWETLRLRAGKNDAYNPFIIDEWMRRSFAGMGAAAPQGFIATLFINGQFKSYFNPTERPRGSFFREFYGTENDFDINYIGEWEEGDPVAYNQMTSHFRNADFSVLSNYQQGATMWDMTNVADYIIVNGWAATQDWPHNNYAFFRERAPGALWRFSMWDAEGAMGRFGQSNQHNTFETELHLSSASSPGSEGTMAALVFRRAQQNPEFRLLFADRLQKHFFNGGVMTRTNMLARWTALRTQVEPLVAAVFGSAFDNGYWNTWSSRDATFLAQARTAGLWPATSAPVLTPFGGMVGAGGAVTLSNPNSGGTLYYTTNGTDPRAVGGSPQGTVYTGAITVSSPLTIKARVRSTAGEWSPLVEAAFAPPPQRIVVTELNYNPPGPDDETEFIELTNVSNQPAPLNGAHFTQGIEFTFGNLTLAPGASVVLVKDENAFKAAYSGVAVGGVYAGSLDNSGETLTLRDIAENVILTFVYSDSNVPGWPASPDGDGATLVLKRPFHTSTDPGLPGSWRPSTATGGAPGQADSTLFSGNPIADADGDGYSALVEYALGTSDNEAKSIPQLTMVRDDQGRLQISASHPVAADDVVIEALESTNLKDWNAIGLQEQVPVASSAQYRSTWQSTTSGPNVFLRLRVRQN